MTINKPPDWTSGQWIALYAFTVAALLSWFAFLFARGDHDMKMLAIGGVLSVSSTLVGTASAILVGKPATSAHAANDLPAGASQVDISAVTAPPTSPGSQPGQ